jgi:hypothetical protein
VQRHIHRHNPSQRQEQRRPQHEVLGDAVWTMVGCGSMWASPLCSILHTPSVDEQGLEPGGRCTGIKTVTEELAVLLRPFSRKPLQDVRVIC